jgi:hypothetical protein
MWKSGKQNALEVAFFIINIPLASIHSVKEYLFTDFQ